MSAALPRCTNCRTVLPVTQLNRPSLEPCASCGSLIQVEVFPALFRAPAERPAYQAIVLADEAGCFYHPLSKALHPCDGCGRFLCALCDCEVKGRHLCPGCLEAGRSKGILSNLENERTRYDNIALAVALLPVVLIFGVYLTFITAPLAIYLAIRHWNSPLSIIPRTKIRYVLAIIFAATQIIGWIILLYFLFS